MAILDLLENEFVQLNLTEGNTPSMVKAIASSIYSSSIPYRMKLAIAYSELVLYFSQFRINIRHWNGSSIPINAITFCLAKSGASKDSSVYACRQCFKDGYKLIEEHRKKAALTNAIEAAKKKGVSTPDRYISYKDFYKEPSPLFIAPSTSEGVMQHLNDLKQDIVGSGFIHVSELASELDSNNTFIDVVKLVSEIYDMGNKNAKIIKSREFQNKGITNFPLSALFLGSPVGILYDQDIKKKFKIEFTSKLARRSFFIFANDDLSIDNITDVHDLISRDVESEDRAIEVKDKINKYIGEITKECFFDENTPKELTVSKEVRNLFNFYKRYNEAQSEIISERLPITKLSRAHMQWKAFKLSGALALLDLKSEIEEKHYRAAVEYCEYIADDVHQFELELVKEPYELFCSYAHTYEIEGKYEISLHELKKAGFIPNRNLVSTAMSELVKMANSYDTSGVYTFNKDNNVVQYERKEVTEKILVSYVPVYGSKAQRAKICASGYQCIETTFKGLEELLRDDYAYTCFKFANGIRGKENIISATKWLILDVDDSEITDEEADMLLSEINHYIVRTSNPDNPYKYRVLLELDTEINVPDYHWIKFIQNVSLDLGFITDKRPKSQIFFSYKDRTILSQLEARPLDTTPYMRYLNKINLNYNYVDNTNYSDIQKQNMLNDPMTTFEQAYNAPDGLGMVKLCFAARLARELGASKEYTKNLIIHIAKEYWVKKLSDNRLAIFLNQIDRWQGFKE